MPALMTVEQEVAATTAGEIDAVVVVVDVETFREELEADFFDIATTEDEEEEEGADAFDPTGFPYK